MGGGVLGGAPWVEVEGRRGSVPARGRFLLYLIPSRQFQILRKAIQGTPQSHQEDPLRGPPRYVPMGSLRATKTIPQGCQVDPSGPPRGSLRAAKWIPQGHQGDPSGPPRESLRATNRITQGYQGDPSGPPRGSLRAAKGIPQGHSWDPSGPPRGPLPRLLITHIPKPHPLCHTHSSLTGAEGRSPSPPPTGASRQISC